MAYKTLRFFEQSDGYGKLDKIKWRDAVYNKLVEVSPAKGRKLGVSVSFLEFIVDHAGPGLPGMDGN